MVGRWLEAVVLLCAVGYLTAAAVLGTVSPNCFNLGSDLPQAVIDGVVVGFGSAVPLVLLDLKGCLRHWLMHKGCSFDTVKRLEGLAHDGCKFGWCEGIMPVEEAEQEEKPPSKLASIMSKAMANIMPPTKVLPTKVDAEQGKKPPRKPASMMSKAKVKAKQQAKEYAKEQAMEQAKEYGRRLCEKPLCEIIEQVLPGWGSKLALLGGVSVGLSTSLLEHAAKIPPSILQLLISILVNPVVTFALKGAMYRLRVLAALPWVKGFRDPPKEDKKDTKTWTSNKMKTRYALVLAISLTASWVVLVLKNLAPGNCQARAGGEKFGKLGAFSVSSIAGGFTGFVAVRAIVNEMYNEDEIEGFTDKKPRRPARPSGNILAQDILNAAAVPGRLEAVMARLQSGENIERSFRAP